MSITLHIIIAGSMAATAMWVIVTLAVLAAYGVEYLREGADALDRLIVRDERTAR